MIRLAVPVPELIHYDEDNHILAKAFDAGEPAAERAARDALDPAFWEQLFALSDRCREGGHNLDWFPTNFHLTDSRLVCLDYEAPPWSVEWSLENWALWYWVNPAGLATFLRTSDGDVLNGPGSYRSIETPELAVRRRGILDRYARSLPWIDS